MLEKPDLEDERIIACLNDDYGLPVAQVAFLPLGADRHTAVYHIVAGDGISYIDASDTFYIVDWDNPILAPKERDLMFAGGGQGVAGHSAAEEEALFYEGYGETEEGPCAATRPWSAGPGPW